MEFMVTMDVLFRPHMPLNARRELLRQESEAARPYLDSGKMSRVWRSWGSHEMSHGHLALWVADSAYEVRLAYESFPLVKLGYGVVKSITKLQVNPNDRKNKIAKSPVPLTYDSLYRFLTDNGKPSDLTNEGLTAEISPGVTVHDHPHSGRPREIHFMVLGQKIAEIGPVTESLQSENVAPGYVDLLAEWDGKPVLHDAWKNAILRDNGLLHPSHEAAKAAPRVRLDVEADPNPGYGY